MPNLITKEDRNRVLDTLEEIASKHKNVGTCGYNKRVDYFDFFVHIKEHRNAYDSFTCIVNYNTHAHYQFFKCDENLVSVRVASEKEFYDQIVSLATTLALPHGVEKLKKEHLTELET